MVVKKDYKIAILKGSISEIDILVMKHLTILYCELIINYLIYCKTAPSGDLRILSEELRKCSDCRITNLDDAVEKVLSGNYVAILVRFQSS